MKTTIKTIGVFLVLMACSVTGVFAQGTPQVRIFADYQYSNHDGASFNKFEITRAYFGYAYKFSDAWNAKLTLDVGDPSDTYAPDATGKMVRSVAGLQMTAYLKQAYLQYVHNGLKINMGMTNTIQFAEQESFWAHRYVRKSFQDEYRFNSSADIGVTASYKINDIFTVDAAIMNGQGYKQVESDSVFRYGIGVTIHPVKGLMARVYYDDQNKNHWYVLDASGKVNYIGGSAQQSISTFLGYKADKFYVGGEYNLQKNMKDITNHTLSGVSFYGNYQFKPFGVYARYDQLWSNKLDGATEGWNTANDQSTYLIGVEFNPVKGVKISPNYMLKQPAKSGAKSTSYLSASLRINI